MGDNMVYWLILIGIAVLTLLGSINAFLLSSISGRIAKMEKKLEATQSKDECSAARQACQKVLERSDKRQCDEIKDVWNALSTHSHTGLPADSRVTR